MTSLAVIGAIICIGTLYVLVPVMLDAYRRFRGTRLVTCPETSQPAAVEVDAIHAALTAAIDDIELGLSTCSRWPERRDCGQPCLVQIEQAPAECLVRTVVTKWYEGKRCVLCGRPFEISQLWLEKPALRAPDGTTQDWTDVRSEALPGVLASHQPVCWNCHVADAFRRQYPQLVIDRPPTRSA